MPKQQKREMETDQNQNNQTENSNELESLESQPAVMESSENAGLVGSSAQLPPDQTPSEPQKPKKPRSSFRKKILARFNIYLLLFILLLIIAGVVSAVSFIKSGQSEDKNREIATEPLSEEALKQLRQTDVKIGDPKQILNVESNAIFAGKVLVRDSLEVAGEIRSGGSISAPGLTISGNSILNQVQASGLQVGGNATIQGQLSVQNNLTVTGSGSFGGTLTAARLNIQDLQINGDLQIARHIDAGGGTPGKSDGSALGGGGTSSVSGTDTAGTVSINTGGGAGAGCFITVNFAQKYNGTPHVVITPVGSAAANLNYYINRNSSNFSICSTNSPGGGQNFSFDYVVID